MSARPRVGLFVTCLVDLHRPNVGFAALRLLEAAGCEVLVPESQTCCGQPAFNSGDDRTTRKIARATIAAFDDVEHVVAPSGSCAGMLRAHYPGLLADDPEWAARAEDFSVRCHELTSFLVDVLGRDDIACELGARRSGRITYHDSCAGLRELGVRNQPRRLLAGVEALEIVEMADTDVCCGFGGTFCVKYPDISERMADDKLSLAAASGADTLLGGDLGCLLSLAGRLARRGQPTKVYHVAEVLAGMTDVPAIGRPEP